MLKWDEEYDNLCKKILNEGVEVENRTANNTIKINNYCFNLDIAKQFPILTTKQTFYRQAFLELMWIYLVQSNDVNWLQDRKVGIWDEWKIDSEGYWTAPQKIKQPDGSFKIEEVKKYFGPEYAGTIGTAYGYLVKKFGKTQKALDLLINHPESRRNVVTLWHDDYLSTGVLEPCVWSHEINITNGALNMFVHQRSCDVPLGLPFNVTQYAALMHMYAKAGGYEVGNLAWSITDAHIYINQIPMIEEQIKRAETIRNLEKFSKEELLKLKGHYAMFTDEEISRNHLALQKKAVDYILNDNIPEIWLNPEIGSGKENFFKYDTSKDCKDIKVLKYKHMGKLDIPVSA